ncbi:PR-1-like protein [Wilcoxina mikolae CBS 423.85]|nr:PR-1-like protein [Wilcoxina mikolae CBS 423.85]
MRSSIVLVAAIMAAVGIATPVNIEKRDYVTETSTCWETQTVDAYESEYTPHHRHPKYRKFKHYEPVEASPTPTPTPDYPSTPTYGDDNQDKPKDDTPKETPSSDNQGSTKGPDDFSQQCLDSHNKYRAQHGAPALEWDSDMANHAESVSSTCIFQHSNSDYGENLAAGYDSPESAIAAWVNEEDQYSYSAGQFDMATGHFTQVVWKSAKKVGCASYDCEGKGGTPGKFFTCNYDTGNVVGEFVQNVLPKQS